MHYEKIKRFHSRTFVCFIYSFYLQSFLAKTQLFSLITLQKHFIGNIQKYIVLALLIYFVID